MESFAALGVFVPDEGYSDISDSIAQDEARSREAEELAESGARSSSNLKARVTIAGCSWMLIASVCTFGKTSSNVVNRRND